MAVNPYGAPFDNFEELIVFSANNALTGGDNQVLIDGRERSGKTTLGRVFNRYLYQYLHHDAIQRSIRLERERDSAIARAGHATLRTGTLPSAVRPPRYLPAWRRDWDFLGNVIFDFSDWQTIYDREEDLGQHQIDEGGNLLFSRDAMTGENKQVVRTVQMCGIRHATMTWILPNKHWMDPYIREHRATVWGHVHTSYTLNGMTRGLASWHWRLDNYMTGNVWWSPPVFWQKFEEAERDWEQAGYDAVKAAKLQASTVSQPAKGRRVA